MRMKVTLLLMALGFAGEAWALLEREAISGFVTAPYQVGPRLDDRGIHELQNADGTAAGYVFETRHLAPIPGFAGQPINLLVAMGNDLVLLGVWVIEQHEPVFVSGLGEAPFHRFATQYRGRSIGAPITVGAVYGAVEQSTVNDVLDGVAKATASVRIANDTVLAAARQVARELAGVAAASASSRPRQERSEMLSWDDLEARGLVHRISISTETAREAFAGSLWEDDGIDGVDGSLLDLWVLDIGPADVRHAVLDDASIEELGRGNAVRSYEEPVLLLANGPYRLFAADFVPNTAPDRIVMRQGGLPVSVFDAYMDVGLRSDVPDFEQVALLRVDRRLGFDPAAPWELGIRLIREHGSFMPQVGHRDRFATLEPDPGLFVSATPGAPRPAWLEGLASRAGDVVVLALLLAGLATAMALGLRRLAAWRRYRAFRLGFLAVILVFAGWYGQGQLSIVTPLAAASTVVGGGSFAFLLYDPFSLLLWAVTLGSLLVWGRGFFCGWLCPYGALQELTHAAGRRLGIRSVSVPRNIDRALKLFKYPVLGVLVATALWWPRTYGVLVEVEPFKTAITVGFVREAGFVLYALAWLVLGLWVFRAFCRYVCPLGALFALADRVRRLDFIPRRAECGNPCQLCRHRCEYGAIEPSGAVVYRECFQCLDCVTIHEDAGRCAPLIVAARRHGRAGSAGQAA